MNAECGKGTFGPRASNGTVNITFAGARIFKTPRASASFPNFIIARHP